MVFELDQHDVCHELVLFSVQNISYSMNKKCQNIKPLYNCILNSKTIINKFTGIILSKILLKKKYTQYFKISWNNCWKGVDFFAHVRVSRAYSICRRQQWFKFISSHSKIVRLWQSFAGPSQLISQLWIIWVYQCVQLKASVFVNFFQ